VVNNIADVISVLDMNLRFTYVSPSIVGLRGYTAEEVINQTIEEVMTPESLQAVVGVFEEELKREADVTADPGRTRILEFQEYRKDGSVIWVENHLSFLRNDKQEPVGFIALSRDISDRKRAEEALKESKERLDLAMAVKNEGIWDWDLNTNATYFDDRYYTMVGYAPGEFTQNFASWEERVHPEDLPEAQSAIARYLNGQSSIFDIEFRFRRRDGSWMWIQGLAKVVKSNVDGTPLRIIGTHTDITERKRAELALRESEERFRVAQELSPDGFTILRPIYDAQERVVDFTWVYENATIARLNGTDPKAVVGRRLLELFPGHSGSQFLRAYQLVVESGEHCVFEADYCGESITKPTWFRIAVVPMGGDIAILAQDITDRKRAEEALRKSEENYRQLFDNSPAGIYQINFRTGKFLKANDVICEYLGCSQEEITSLSPYDFITQESQKLLLERLNKMAMGDKVPEDPEYEIVDKNGKRRWLKLNSHNYYDSEGLAGANVVAHDITARKQVEEQLQQTLESLRKAFGAIIQVMVSAVESRDPYTAGHQMRSADLVRAIATEMGFTQDRIEGVRMAGSIHDIGKLSIPAEILSKPTKLSEIEFSLIKEHARKGYEMLKNVESPWPLAEIVHQHHERMDGSGYPQKLKGEEILMEARILAVADVVEAMASHRPYRPGLGINTALDEIEKNRGIFYDKTVADACLRLFREKGFMLEGA